MEKKITIIIISIIISLLIFYTIIQIGIKINPIKPKNNNEIEIVTTIFPYYDFARAVVGSENNIHLLINPGTEIHSYEPTPVDLVKIQNADVFIYNGGENDAWVEEILETIDTSNITIIKMMDYVDKIEEDNKNIYSSEEEKEELEYDEHIWTSPKNAIKLVQAIEENLIKIDESKKSIYEFNARNYIEKIEEIDNNIKEIVNNSKSKLLIFGDRFPFRYFIEQYNLKYKAAFAGCSTETEPSASTVVNLINDIKNNDIPVVLYIELSSKKVANTLAEETNVEVMCLHSCQSISKEDFENGKTYVSIMRDNVNVLKYALR